MNSASKITILIFALFCVSRISYAQNDKGDNWFGKDKFQHFTVSAFYSGGTAIVANKHFDMPRKDSIVLGVSIAISLGGAKEIYDHSKPNETSSLKDLIWDIGGSLAGGVIAGLVL